ncbi:hypothetical protein HAX54_035035 [Datura stramonium]|uniref:Protein kinase domain-containing protein n=1 Tax=Datura stramonium TaxID=4076 RepID=A0ABS8SF73_DATST|nr:hypothetical protein [Datura stramonium]
MVAADHFYMVLARVCGRKMVSGLMYLHSHNIIHGDIKPDNLFSDCLPAVKDDNDKLRRSPGTPVFTAPECCLGERYHGKAADTWAVGVTLYCMILGKYPFLGDTLELHMTRCKSPRISDIVNNPIILPDDMNPLLKKSLVEGFSVGSSLIRLTSLPCHFMAMVATKLSAYFPNKNCLCTDPTQRMTLENVSQHEWDVSFRQAALAGAKECRFGLHDDVALHVLLGLLDPDYASLSCLNARNKWLRLPKIPCDDCFNYADKESLAVGSELLVFGRELFDFAIWKYSLIQNNWEKCEGMNHRRCLFGSDGNTAKHALSRRLCSGFFMDGKFYVIAGMTNPTDSLTCGEEFDLQTRKWRKIEGMFPNVNKAAQAPPLVAVVNNQAYAVEYLTNMIKKYDKKKNSWEVLGRLPVRADSSNSWVLLSKHVVKNFWW